LKQQKTNISVSNLLLTRKVRVSYLYGAIVRHVWKFLKD